MPEPRFELFNFLFISVMFISVAKLSILPLASTIIIFIPRLLTFLSAFAMFVPMPGLSASLSAIYSFILFIINFNQSINYVK